MEIRSIEEIKYFKENLEEQIKNLGDNVDSETLYGSEREYTLKTIIFEVKAMLEDINSLISAPDIFIKISSFDERTILQNNLKYIHNYLTSPINYISYFESLKTLLRSFNLKNTEEKLVQFEREILRAHGINVSLEQELLELRQTKSQIENNQALITSKLDESNLKLQEIDNDLTIIIERKNDLYIQSETLSETNEKLINTKDRAEETLNEIFNSLNEAKSSEKLIDSYVKKINETDQRLINLDTKSKHFEEKLAIYKKEQSEALSDARSLIVSAKEALNYKTAEGISAAFQEQYNSANKKSIFGSWIFGAILSLIATICLGIWIIQTATSDIIILISRIALLPLPIMGTFFCANQYTRQKNIIEDYAYKMVLSKAIVGFSEQLKKHGSENNEEYIHYIKTALKEIHKDPLRKREKNKANKGVKGNVDELIGIAERIVKMTKSD